MRRAQVRIIGSNVALVLAGISRSRASKRWRDSVSSYYWQRFRNHIAKIVSADMTAGSAASNNKSDAPQ